MQKQDLGKLQTRKMKGLKRKSWTVTEDAKGKGEGEKKKTEGTPPKRSKKTKTAKSKTQQS